MRITMKVIYVPFGLRCYVVNNKFYKIINVFDDGYSVFLRDFVHSFFVGVHLSAPLRHC